MRGALWLVVAATIWLFEPAASAQAPGTPSRGAAPAWEAMLEEFMGLVDAGKGDAAIDWINAHGQGFAQRDKAEPEWARNHRLSFQKLLGPPGSRQGHAVINERHIGDRLAHIDYALWGEDRPQALGLTLYRVGGGSWLVLSWSWGTPIEKLLDPTWGARPDAEPSKPPVRAAGG